MRGRARYARTLARVGSVRVYRRDGITFPLARRRMARDRSAPFTGLLQGIHTRAKQWEDRRGPGSNEVTTNRSRVGNTSASLHTSRPRKYGAPTTMTTVLAYLDPGSGSMILQIIAGGLAAVAVTAKLYWNRILQVPAHPQGRAGGPQGRPARQRKRVARRPAASPRPRRKRPRMAACARLSPTMPRAVTPPADASTAARRPRARLLPRPREPRLLRRRRGLPGALARRAERLRGAAASRACSTTSGSCAPSCSRDGAAGGRAAREGLLVHEPAGVLRHERIPFVSYPYEWTFSMLKDAALVQLDLLLAVARARPGAEGLDALQRAVQGRPPGVRRRGLLRAHTARASPGSAIASSACSTSTRCCCRR